MMKKFPVQILSDLHLNINHITDFSQIVVPKASTLILAGDTSNISPQNMEKYRSFLRFCSREFDSVYMVSGNHEYYFNTCKKYFPFEIELEREMKTGISKIDSKIRTLCSEFPCVSFLQKNCVNIPEYNINLLGCTLWTKIPLNFQYINNVQDFKEIYQFNTSKRNILHNDHKEWLKSTLSKTKRNIVLTHHAPLFTGVFQPQYEDSYFSCLFASNVNDLYPNIDTWIYGHTHKNIDVNLGYNYPRFISNPLGFSTDQNNYFPDKIFYL